MTKIINYLHGLKNSDRLFVSTQILLIAYLLGQGSVLLVQLMSYVLNKNELTGYLVLIVAVFSFSFQFSDLGNSTYVTKISKKELNKSEHLVSFVLARAMFGSFFTVILFLYVLWEQEAGAVIIIYSFFMIITVFFYSFSKVTGEEHKGKYFPVAAYNVSHWLFVSFGLCVFTIVEEKYYPIVAISHCVLMLILAVKTSNFRFDIFSYRPAYKVALQFILPQVAGQAWGRVVLFIIASVKGVAEVGILGLTKYAQVFFTLMFGFYTRPILRKYIVEKSGGYSVIEIIYLYKKFLILFLFIPLLYISLVNLLPVFGVENKWLMVVLIVPFSILSQAVMQISYLNLSEIRNLIISSCGLMSNIGVFFFFFDKDIVYSLVFGEISQCLVNILLYSLMINFRYGKH